MCMDCTPFFFQVKTTYEQRTLVLFHLAKRHTSSMYNLSPGLSLAYFSFDWRYHFLPKWSAAWHSIAVQVFIVSSLFLTLQFQTWLNHSLIHSVLAVVLGGLDTSLTSFISRAFYFLLPTSASIIII